MPGNLNRVLLPYLYRYDYRFQEKFHLPTISTRRYMR